MLSKILFVLGVALIGSAIGEGEDDTCQSQGGKVLNGTWFEKCANPEMISLEDMKQAIVDKHNELRNEIALGRVAHYDKAAKMATMQWDDDLAKMAEWNVRQCKMDHDNCGSKIKRYPYAGQNLAMNSYSLQALKDVDDFTAHVDGWFEEHERGAAHGWMDNIKIFKTMGEKPNVVGHFTQVVRDNANRVGCAASTSMVSDNHVVWFACNYSYGNMVTVPVYVTGDPASKCTLKANPKYAGLCHPDEPYDVYQ